MRFLFTSLITLLGGTVAIAHNEVPDSIAARELDEIVVQAPRVIRKADMDVFYPSQTAVEYSKNGMQMLRNLMIPTFLTWMTFRYCQVIGAKCAAAY